PRLGSGGDRRAGRHRAGRRRMVHRRGKDRLPEGRSGALGARRRSPGALRHRAVLGHRARRALHRGRGRTGRRPGGARRVTATRGKPVLPLVLAGLALLLAGLAGVYWGTAELSWGARLEALLRLPGAERHLMLIIWEWR